MARVHHRHHCHLYRNHHWFSLLLIQNSLECGINNQTTNEVAGPKVHATKIRRLNLAA